MASSLEWFAGLDQIQKDGKKLCEDLELPDHKHTYQYCMIALLDRIKALEEKLER